MLTIKNTARATVRVTGCGTVSKWYRHRRAAERYENEVRILRYLESVGCPFVPRLLDCDPVELRISMTNVGHPVERISKRRLSELFDALETYGVRHDDAEQRNVTYDPRQGQFCLIDFEFATILGSAASAGHAASLMLPIEQRLDVLDALITDALNDA